MYSRRCGVRGSHTHTTFTLAALEAVITPAVTALATALAAEFGIPPQVAVPIAGLLAKEGVGMASKGIKALRKKAAPKRQGALVRKPQLRAVPAGRSVMAPVPISVGLKRATARPIVQNLANGDIVIHHTEYYADLNGTVAFNATGRPINPVSTLFPWLRALANRYESYVFEELSFIYQHACATTQAGTVMMFVDYDVTDAKPLDKQQALGNRGAQRGAPYEDFVFDCLREDLHQRKSYFCGPKAPTAADAKLHNVGQLWVCTSGAGTSMIGELSVRYKIRLMTPQLGNIRVGDSIYMARTGTSKNDPFGTLVTSDRDFPADYTAPADVPTFTFTQPWSGFVTVNITGTTLTGSTPTGTGSETEIFETLLADATKLSAGYYITCGVGDTFILTLGSAAISAAAIYFYQGGDPASA